MASNNLRIIYENYVDLSDTTITLTTGTTYGATSLTYLKKDAKALVWQNNNTTCVLTVTMASDRIVGGVILPFCNLSATATIRMECQNTAGTTVTNGDSGTTTAAPYAGIALWDWGGLPLGANSYSYGGGTYGRVWLPNHNQVSCRKIKITIIDNDNSLGRIELSRIVIGAYWSPTYNTSFGLSTKLIDKSVHDRTEAGDLITSTFSRHNSLSFDLAWMIESDRAQFGRIARGNGLPRPIFISLFPNDPNTTNPDYGKEQAHQIYGKFVQYSPVSHPIHTIFSTNVEIEEI